MPLSRRRIRELAEGLLDDANVDAPPVPVERLVRTRGALIRPQSYDDKISGFLYRDHDRTVIGVNSDHHPHRRRFTIAHELGHALLHKGIVDEVHVDRAFQVKMRDERSSQGTDIEEREANLFAAELLMPVRFLEQDLSDVDPVDLLDEAFVLKLARRYRVSVQALLFRLSNLGYISL